VLCYKDDAKLVHVGLALAMKIAVVVDEDN